MVTGVVRLMSSSPVDNIGPTVSAGTTRIGTSDPSDERFALGRLPFGLVVFILFLGLLQPLSLDYVV